MQMYRVSQYSGTAGGASMYYIHMYIAHEDVTEPTWRRQWHTKVKQSTLCKILSAHKSK